MSSFSIPSNLLIELCERSIDLNKSRQRKIRLSGLRKEAPPEWYERAVGWLQKSTPTPTAKLTDDEVLDKYRSWPKFYGEWEFEEAAKFASSLLNFARAKSVLGDIERRRLIESMYKVDKDDMANISETMAIAVSKINLITLSRSDFEKLNVGTVSIGKYDPQP